MSLDDDHVNETSTVISIPSTTTATTIELKDTLNEWTVPIVLRERPTTREKKGDKILVSRRIPLPAIVQSGLLQELERDKTDSTEWDLSIPLWNAATGYEEKKEKEMTPVDDTLTISKKKETKKEKKPSRSNTEEVEKTKKKTKKKSTTNTSTSATLTMEENKQCPIRISPQWILDTTLDFILAYHSANLYPPPPPPPPPFSFLPPLPPLPSSSSTSSRTTSLSSLYYHLLRPGPITSANAAEIVIPEAGEFFEWMIREPPQPELPHLMALYRFATWLELLPLVGLCAAGIAMRIRGVPPSQLCRELGIATASPSFDEYNAAVLLLTTL